MSHFNKNPPWAREGVTGIQGQIDMGAFSQQQTSSSGFNQQMVGYPDMRAVSSAGGSAANALKQRVFTGFVTKLQDLCGLIDEDVLFQMSCVKGQQPKLGDRVLVEASYNTNFQSTYKWNATRVQVLPAQTQNQTSFGQQAQQSTTGFTSSLQQQQQGSLYQATGAAQLVAALQAASMIGAQMQNNQLLNQQSNQLMNQMQSIAAIGGTVGGAGRISQPARRPDPAVLGERDRRGTGRETSWDRPDRRRPRKRSRSPSNKSRSPRRSHSPRKSYSPSSRAKSPSIRSGQRWPSTATPSRTYNVTIPKITLDLKDASVMTLRSRYSNMYIPSDFFNATAPWMNMFPMHQPLERRSCQFHVMNKEVPSIRADARTASSTIDPPDVDHRYSAKVMLLSCPSMQDIFHKSCSLAEDPSEIRDSFQHPSRLIQFLVGLKGKAEPMAIGGLWSPSLDGSDPESDPRVLIKTAIRTTFDLTGIDLSRCTRWFRFAEIRYYRAEETRKGRVMPAHVETVVMFLPDVWSCVPTLLDWPNVLSDYRKQLEEQLEAESKSGGSVGEDDDCAADDSKDGIEEDEKDVSMETDADNKTPTHFALLDPKTMKVGELRRELKCRGLQSKGIKSQLCARLGKALKQEQEQEEKEKSENSDEANIAPTEEELKAKEFKEKREAEEHAAEKQKKLEEEQKAREKKCASLERMYSLPDKPCILVHPSATAKGGKFDCSVKSLSVLLDYRPEDNKEHLFEVSLFAEMFNEMLMRDCGFRIYKAFVKAKEPVQENKEKMNERKTKSAEEEKTNGDEALAAKRIKTEESSLIKKEASDKVDEDIDSVETKTEDTKFADIKVADNKNKTKDVKSEEDDSSKSKKKRENGKEKSTAVDDDDDEDDLRHRSVSKKQQYVTADPQLLLSFVYFDVAHTGYLQEKDAEDLLLTIGLQLSRAQIKKLVAKVLTKDVVNYRKLTDKPIESVIDGCEVKPDGESVDRVVEKETLAALDDKSLAQGNLPLIPSGANKSSSTSKEEGHNKGKKSAIHDSVAGLVEHNGAVVDVGGILETLSSNERLRADIETNLINARKEIDSLKSKLSSSRDVMTKTQQDLHETKKRLREQTQAADRAEDNTKVWRALLNRINTTLTVVTTDIGKAVAPPATKSHHTTPAASEAVKKSDSDNDVIAIEDTGDIADVPA